MIKHSVSLKNTAFMNRKIKIISIFVLATLLMASCVPVNEAINHNGKRTSQNRNHSSSNRHSSSNKNNSSSSKNNSSSSSSKSDDKANYSDAVYQNSKNYLKKHNTRLTNYCIDWIGTPHVLGGTTKKGVDCSGFVCNVYQDVFNIKLPRRSGDMAKEVNIFSSYNKLKEGDLVFFGKNNINHVGIFLNETNFIHTSTSKGVIVSSLEEKYWKENFHSCGHHPKVKN